MIGGHAGIVHAGDRQADDDAADDGGNAGGMAGRGDEAGSGAGHGNEQRGDRQHRIEGDGRARVVSQHGDEMRAPDRRSGADGGQEMPADLLQAGGLMSAQEKPDRRPGTGAADQRGDKHQPEVVLHCHTRDDAHHDRDAFLALAEVPGLLHRSICRPATVRERPTCHVRAGV